MNYYPRKRKFLMPVNDPNFGSDFSFGKQGELFAQQLLLKERGIVTYPTNGKCDYDLVTTDLRTIEVKRDKYYHKGNICLELWSNKAYKTIGWLQKAFDVLVYIWCDTDGTPRLVKAYDFPTIQKTIKQCWFNNDWDSNTKLQTVNAKHNENWFVENVLMPREWLEVFRPVTLYQT
jgi:hypothetical protein